MEKHIVVFSHGFGVRKDDRGLFTAIAEGLPNIQSVLVDLNDINEESGEIKVRPLDIQSNILHDVIQDTMREYAGSTIDVICHSQGAFVAALGAPLGIRKTISLAPMLEIDIPCMMSMFKQREGTEIHPQGLSKLARADGSVTLVPPEYWINCTDIDPLDVYNDFAKDTQLSMIIAGQDEQIKPRNTTGLLHNIQTIVLNGNHNFEGDSRIQLIETIRTILMS